MLKPSWSRRTAVALVIGAAAFSALAMLAEPASAQGSWCAEYSGRNAGTNCGFYSLSQCRATVRGVGGYCRPSSYAYGYARPHRHYRHRYY
jgi:hypothetical protein